MRIHVRHATLALAVGIATVVAPVAGASHCTRAKAHLVQWPGGVPRESPTPLAPDPELLIEHSYIAGGTTTERCFDIGPVAFPAVPPTMTPGLTEIAVLYGRTFASAASLGEVPVAFVDTGQRVIRAALEVQPVANGGTQFTGLMPGLVYAYQLQTPYLMLELKETVGASPLVVKICFESTQLCETFEWQRRDA